MVSFFHFKRRGRNNMGRITVRHRGAGTRFFAPNFSYFRPTLKNFKLVTLPFARIRADLHVTMLDRASNGRYNLFFSKYNASAPKYLFEFSIGQLLFDIELTPSRGPKFCRSSGSHCQLLRKRGTYATVKFPSGEIRRLSVFCSARLWSPESHSAFSNFHNLPLNTRKAGFSRWLGVRPHVRGCAINPVDHPHGGRTGDSRPSVSPWAQLTKGYRTRFRQVNKKFVLMSVQAMKDRQRLVSTLVFNMRDYKFFIPDPRLLLRLTRSNSDLNKPIFLRSSLLFDIFIGKKAFVYDGHQFRFIFVKPEHLYYPVGSFIFTKKTGMRIHIDKSKKDKKK